MALKLVSGLLGGRRQATPSRKDAVMFQGFGWDSCNKGGWWRQVKARIPELKQAGCTHLWLPPPSQSVAPQGYLPGQLYNLDASKYGTKDELRDLVSAARAAGIVALADIVINHRCADEMVDGVYNKYRDDVDHKGERIDWGQWAVTCDDPLFNGQGNADTGADYPAAPDLDHKNPQLRAALAEWLAWLQADLGFGGWRLDFAKGYAAAYVEEYVDKTVGKDALNVGEFWVDMAWDGSEMRANQDVARQALCDWIDGNKHSAAAFDFPTKGILQEAVSKTQYWRLRDSQGKAPGLIGWWPGQAVTFTDNHDTGSSQQHWPFPSNRMAVGYAYILTHPGVPCVFWEHYFDWGAPLRGAIDSLIQVRLRNGISSESKLTIHAAEGDMYMAEIDGKVLVKLGPRMDMGSHAPAPGSGWAVAASGDDYCVWEKK
ncbi:MAG: alpha-amylase [Monoraphidium minutum]|nr:MAG: alpha-amylase [Monoraphidium minutum]